MSETEKKVDSAIQSLQAELRQGKISRRHFLRYAALLGMSLSAAAVAAQCGAPAPTPAAATPAPAATEPPATTAPVPTEAPTAAPTAAPTEAAAAAPTAEGEATLLRVAMDIPVQLDPAFASSDTEIAILNAAYDYLVDVDHESNILPRLASKWDVSEDGLTYTFTLAPNIKFHDGSDLTPEDVVWTFDRLRDPAQELPTSSLYANIDSITAGDGRVIFKLKQTNPFFLYDLSDNHALVVKAKAEKPGLDFNGTGPFKVTNYSPENRIEFEANPDYFMAGLPGVAKMQMIFFKDQPATVDALRGGQVDLAMRMPTPKFLELQNEAGIKAVSVATNGFDVVRLRSDREPGNNPKVTEALKLATDREAIFQAVALGLGAVGRDSPIGPLFKAYYTEETPIPARDPAKAKALLAEAGFANGLKMDLHVPDSGDRPDLATVLKEQWAEAGFDVNIVVEPESVYYGDNGWLEVDLGITGWGSRPYPQFYLDVMLVTGAKWNESHFSDPEFDKLAKTAGTTLDEEERVKAYHEIQRILIERGPIIVPFFNAEFGAVKDTFTGFNLKAFPGRTDLAAIKPAG